MTNQLFRDYLDGRIEMPAKPKPPTMAEAFSTIGKIIYDAYAELFAGLKPLVKTLQDAGLIETPPPTDPRERALWMRDHRNTGPALPNLTQRGRTTKYRTK